jgi:hypothetical protein
MHGELTYSIELDKWDEQSHKACNVEGADPGDLKGRKLICGKVSGRRAKREVV